MVKRLMSDKDYYLSMANRPISRNKFSRYRGVHKSTNPDKPYRAAFRHKGETYFLGNYVDEIDAARAYNEAIVRVVGDYAIINELPNNE